jgi:hypothetical protein
MVDGWEAESSKVRSEAFALRVLEHGDYCKKKKGLRGQYIPNDEFLGAVVADLSVYHDVPQTTAAGGVGLESKLHGDFLCAGGLLHQ